MNFLELGLNKNTIKAIEENGYVEPTTVQADVIPTILEGKDIFTIAPYGCGKTISYILPVIDIISRHNQEYNILIITPSSEESISISDNFARFNKYHDETETEVENAEANVIIGSPNLLIELVEENKIDLSKINILVVDDINLIKKNKLLPELEKILELLPSEKQNIIYTNRRSKETQSILEKILKSPEEIKINKEKAAEANNAPKKPKQIKKETSVQNTTKQEVKKENEVKNSPKKDKPSHRQENNVKEENKAVKQKSAKKTKKEAPVAKEVKNEKQKSNKPKKSERVSIIDKEAKKLVKKHDSFKGKTPDFMLKLGNVAN